MLSLSHRPQLRFKGRIATIDELVVTEAWRRRGVGRALVLHAIERAKVLSVKRLELVAARSHGEGMRRFCESCGFTDVDWVLYRHNDTEPRR
jgi:GNAT superfamily N-acetyltransferase